MEKKEKSEKRQHPRFPTSISVRVKHKSIDDFVTEEIRNISKGGIFVKTSNPLPFGSGVDLEFILPTDNKTIKAKGIVMWSYDKNPGGASSQENGMGLRLKDLSVQEINMIAEYIDKIPTDL